GAWSSQAEPSAFLPFRLASTDTTLRDLPSRHRRSPPDFSRSETKSVCGMGGPIEGAAHKCKPRPPRRDLQREVTLREVDGALDLDGEVRLAVSVQIAVDDGFLAGLLVAQFTLPAGEVVLADEGEGVVSLRSG